MKGNVLSWGVALRKGFQPGMYSYSEVPLGAYEATLDFKIWAKKIMGINCYFTQSNTGKKFQLTVYCKFKKGLYRIEGCEIDFVVCPVERVYNIKVFADQKKKTIFAAASLI